MASTGNPNQQPAVSQQQPFDINKYFKPSNASPPLPLPQSFQNPNNYGPPTPSASYPPPTAGPYSFPLQNPPLFYHHIPNFPPQDQHSTLNHQRSVSFPTPPLQPVPSAPPQNANPGARLMAMLSSPPTDFNYSLQIPTPVPASIPSSSDYPLPTAVPVSPSVVQPMHSIQSAPIRMPSSKLPRGRHLAGDHIIYDIDARLQGEEQPQLEVTPITKYVSDPGLILGHQIAVNKTYICYGLKMGNIRVLNINTALRSLLRGHTQRVTDMAFFAEDVHLLASASIEGRVYVWKISEGINDEEKPLISGNIVLAIHITRDEGSVHPRVCWHCHKQEILVVAIGKSVLKIDTTKVCKGVEFSVEEPLVCAMDKLIDGVQLVGNHEGEVTDLSMCQWMTTRLVSSSKDGTIKIWEDRKAHPLLVLRPHDGHPVDAAKFLPAPHRPEHIMLITAGLLNREVKLWASADEEGWLLPSDAESWRCIQTLELKSSAEPRNEEAFFNQVVALSQGGLLLLANAKKNAIYAIHLEYGANPAATRMDYLAEFTVTMPILSFTGTSDALPHGEHLVQVYCVQTQAIQQYALDLSQCLPPPLENFSLEKSESTVSHDAAECVPALETSGSKSLEAPFSAAKPINHTIGLGSLSESKCSVSAASDATSVHETMTSVVDANPSSLPSASNNEAVSVASPSLPLSPKLSKKLSDLRGDQAATEYSFDRQMDSAQTNSSALPVSNDDSRALPGNASDIANPPVMFKHPTHLVTPFEIMATSSADATRVFEKGENEAKIQDVGVSNDTGNVEVEVKVVGETAFVNTDEPTRQVDPEIVIDRKEKSFYSQASDLGVDMNRECCALPSETSVMEEAKNSIMEALAQPSNSGEEGDEANNDMSGKAADYAVSTAVPQSPTQGAKGKKKGKNPQPSSSLSPLPSVSNSVELLQGTVPGSSLPFMESSASQMLAMQETLNQILTMQKQMSSVVSTSVAKEGRRLEVALGRSIEKASKANSDALWARTQEEITKLEKSLRERIQQTHGLVNNIMSKDFVAVFERTLKKELAAFGTNVARTISPVIEKTISSAISDSFQRGVGEKAVSQLEKSVTSKLEAIVARQIQAQFQTSGKQALQDGLRSCLEASIIPAFEMSCKAMFEQVDSAFQKGVAEHTAAVQHQFETANSQLALTLRDALTSASSLTQTLSGELADNQRKLLALAAAGANSNTGNSLVTQRSNGPLGLHEKVELPFDPTKELSRLISEHKYEEAFTTALQRSDVAIVSWLCSQVDLQHLLSTIPLPLSQGVLLSLLQQLSCDITKDTARKLTWMTDAASCILPHDPMIAVHVRPILEQVYQILNHQRNLPSSSSEELSKNRVLMHLINAMLMTCK